MKRMFNTATLLAALAIISVAVTGCGKSNDSNGTGAPGTPGSVPGFGGGVVQPLPGGGARITFSGANTYNSGVRIYGQTAGFNNNTQYATLTLGTASIPVGQPGTLTGKGYNYPSSTINIVTVPIPGNPLASNLTGVIDLDPGFVASAFGGAMPAVIAIGIDVYTSGSSIYGGSVYICTTKDQNGACHGGLLTI